MVEIFHQVKRVLKPEGTLFLNLGDSYWGSGKGLYGDGTSHGTEGAKQQTNVGSVNVQRADPCGISGKELEDSQGRGCLCENLCDACRLVYQNHRFRNDGLLVAMLSASLSLPSQGSKESVNGHSPTLDFAFLENHILSSIRDFGHISNLYAERLYASLESKPDVFFQQLLDVCLQRGNSSSCLLCGRSSASYAQVSGHKMVCTCGTGEQEQTFDSRKSDISSLRKAYPYYTITYPVSQTLKQKDQCLIPHRVAMALQADGWYVRDTIIWSKPNPMPESVRDRCTKAHEYIFLLTKKPRYYYDIDAIKEECIESNAERPRMGQGQNTQYNQKRGEAKNLKEKGQQVHSMHINRAAGKGEPQTAVRNKRSVWTVTTAPYSEAHFATFPPKLIEPCILAGCPEWVCKSCGKARVRMVDKGELVGKNRGGNYKGREAEVDAAGQNRMSGCDYKAGMSYENKTTGWTDCGCGEDWTGGVVLDCFAGTNTTGMVAYENRRNYVGIELNPEYIKLNRADLAKEKYGLFK